MSLSVVRGLILKETKVGEADKILTLLVKGVGKISVGAKGSRKTKGALSSGTSLFTYADFTLRSGSKFYYMVQADIICSFYSLTNDIDTMAYASYLLELTEKITMEDIPADETLKLLINILKKMMDKKLNPRLAASIYEFKLLQYNGFMPHLSNCVRCGKPHNNYMSMQGVLCTDCAKNEYFSLPVSDELLYTMNYVISNELPSLLNFSLNQETLDLFRKISSKMTEVQFSLNLNSKKFLESLNLY